VVDLLRPFRRLAYHGAIGDVPWRTRRWVPLDTFMIFVIRCVPMPVIGGLPVMTCKWILGHALYPPHSGI